MSRLGQPTQRFEYVINTLEEELSQSKKDLASVKEALSVNDDENGGWDAYYTAELGAKKMRFEDEVSDFQEYRHAESREKGSSRC